jgi:hypothetical protein
VWFAHSCACWSTCSVEWSWHQFLLLYCNLVLLGDKCLLMHAAYLYQFDLIYKC